MSLDSPPRRVLVTGGSGFLGRHLIQTLLGLGHECRVIDLVRSFSDARVEFVVGDISAAVAGSEEAELLQQACEDVDTVFHTASLTDPHAAFSDIHAVNVLGTRHVISACVAAGVRNLVYISTTAVIFSGRDILGATEEQCAYPSHYLDPYSQLKAEAERLVVAANGTMSPHTGQSLCTVSLRPHAIFGPRDTHFISKLIARARNGDITHMIGDGQNRVDFTYVGNVVHACNITMTQLSDAMAEPHSPPSPEYAAARARIGGQCYFVTNGEPRPFWEFVLTILNETGCIGPTKKISFSIAYFIATVMEAIAWLVSRLPSFLRFRMESTITRHMVSQMGCSQYFSCEKARRDLGYSPIITLDQGIATTINYFFRRKNVKLLRPDPHAGLGQGASQSLGSTPKLVTRVFSEPAADLTADRSSVHAPSSAHPLLRPPSHPSDLHGSPAGHRWPQRHWSSSPPFDMNAAERSQPPFHASPQPPPPHPHHAHALIPSAAHAAVAVPAPSAYSPELLHPHPKRSLQQLPSSMFLNAYAAPMTLPPASLGGMASPPESGGLNSVGSSNVLSSPPILQSASSAGSALPVTKR